jgi:hypothetical protein
MPTTSPSEHTFPETVADYYDKRIPGQVAMMEATKSTMTSKRPSLLKGRMLVTARKVAGEEGSRNWSVEFCAAHPRQSASLASVDSESVSDLFPYSLSFVPLPLSRKASICVKRPSCGLELRWSSNASSSRLASTPVRTDIAPRLPCRGRAPIRPGTHTATHRNVQMRKLSTSTSLSSLPLSISYERPPRREMPIKKASKVRDRAGRGLRLLAPLEVLQLPLRKGSNPADEGLGDSSTHRRVLPKIRLKQVFAPFA